MTNAYKKPRAPKRAKTIKDVSAAYGTKPAASTQTIEAVYDGTVFRPSSPLLLKPNTRVMITIEKVKTRRTKRKSFLETAMSMKIDGPSDFSENLDDYLYRGKPFNDK